MPSLEEAIAELALEKPPDTKPVRVCWGCKKEEPDGQKFKKCPRCKEEGFVSTVFCSQACFRQAWPEHLQWHKNEGKELREHFAFTHDLTKNISFVESTKGTDYDALIGAGCLKIGSKDFAGAKKLFRKAHKLDSRQSDPLDFLGFCYNAGGLENEAASCYEESSQRWALAHLTGMCGDTKVED